MRLSISAIRLSMLLCSLWVASGCAMRVVNLTPYDARGSHAAQLPFEDALAVEVLNASEPDGYGDAARFQHGLRKALQEAHVFRNVSEPRAADFQVDLIARGHVSGRFDSSGVLNFLTWFPGPFILMSNWRGNRYTYHTRADVELIDARTQEVVGSYHVENRHKFIHRSTTPFPILGAALILPGVIRGATNVKPRDPYRKLIYEAAYSDLWRQVVAQIVADRGPYYADRTRERVGRCGPELNAPPIVGAQWSEFAHCQTGNSLR